MTITPENIAYGVAIASAVFAVYSYFRNPQIKTDQDTLKLRGEIDELKKEILEIKTTHIKNIESDMKDLTQTINQLAIQVTRLSTIIDERIPKNQPT